MSVFSATRRLALRLGAAAAFAAALAACGESAPQFKGSDISGTRLGQGMELVDYNGKTRKLSDFSGKVVVAFFGFTQCPDVCPTSLAELAEAMKKLGADADRVQVLLITVDPERDTPDILKQYVTAFDPRFLGLTGTPDQVKKAAASFKAYYAKAPTKDGGYSMDHTAAFYLLDGKGESRVLANNNIGVDALVHDIQALLGLIRPVPGDGPGRSHPIAARGGPRHSRSLQGGCPGLQRRAGALVEFHGGKLAAMGHDHQRIGRGQRRRLRAEPVVLAGGRREVAPIVDGLFELGQGDGIHAPIVHQWRTLSSRPVLQ